MHCWGGNTRGTSFGLVRYQQSALRKEVLQKIEFAGFGSGFG